MEAGVPDRASDGGFGAIGRLDNRTTRIDCSFSRTVAIEQSNCWHRASNSEPARRRDNLSPATITVVTVWGRPFTRRSASRRDGLVFTNRTISRMGADCSANRFSTNTIQPPKASGRNISKAERSKFSEVENSTPRNSASDKIERPQETRLVRLRCSMPTALGRPVEPEV